MILNLRKESTHSLLIINDTLFQLFSFLFVFFRFPSAISFLFFLFYLVTFLIRHLLPLKGHSISFTRGSPLLSSPLFELYFRVACWTMFFNTFNLSILHFCNSKSGEYKYKIVYHFLLCSKCYTRSRQEQLHTPEGFHVP